MATPQNPIWGPACWRILHSSAERFGSAPLRRLPQEERRIWSQLLQSLRYSLPCPQCKRHYQVFYEAHPLPVAFTQADLRVWLYRLHSGVNQRLGKPDLSLSEVQERGAEPFCFSESMGVLAGQMRLAVQRGIGSREDMSRTLRLLEEMKRLYDFF